MRRRAYVICTLVLIAVMLYFAQACECQVFKYDARGKRDPFVPLIGLERAKVFGLEGVVSVEDIRLEGIAVGPGGKKMAVMNGEILREGDKAGVIEVVKIENNTVSLLVSGAQCNIELSKEGGVKDGV